MNTRILMLQHSARWNSTEIREREDFTYMNTEIATKQVLQLKGLYSLPTNGIRLLSRLNCMCFV